MYPQSNSARSVRDLSGVWDFRFNADEPWQPIAVPASYNDQSPDPEFRRHYGMAYYRTTFTVPDTGTNGSDVLGGVVWAYEGSQGTTGVQPGLGVDAAFFGPHPRRQQIGRLAQDDQGHEQQSGHPPAGGGWGMGWE